VIRAAPFAPRRIGPRGFTLIEILVVVIIIAVMSGVALYRVTVTGVDRGLDIEGDRLCDVIEAATQQSGLEGRDLGIRFLPDRYEVLAYSAFANEWQILANDRLYERHTLPDGVHFAIDIEGKTAVLKMPTEKEPAAPQVIISASGDAASYRVSFSREGSDYTFVVDGMTDGTLKVTRPGSTP